MDDQEKQKEESNQFWIRETISVTPNFSSCRHAGKSKSWILAPLTAQPASIPVTVNFPLNVDVLAVLVNDMNNPADNSQERIQDSDFLAFGQLEKLRIALFIWNSLQSLVILRSFLRWQWQ